jgi:hypothetical protein
MKMPTLTIDRDWLEHAVMLTTLREIQRRCRECQWGVSVSDIEELVSSALEFVDGEEKR